MLICVAKISILAMWSCRRYADDSTMADGLAARTARYDYDYDEDDDEYGGGVYDANNNEAAAARRSNGRQRLPL